MLVMNKDPWVEVTEEEIMVQQNSLTELLALTATWAGLNKTVCCLSVITQRDR